jgi:hypothetical protein
MEVDTSNRFLVSAIGDKIVVLGFPGGLSRGKSAELLVQLLTRDDAINLAAWLVALADPAGDDFQRTLKAVQMKKGPAD